MEFDLTGTLDHRMDQRSDLNRSSMRGSRDSRDSYTYSRESTSGMSGRLSNSNNSLGIDYSLDGSLDDSELKR